MARTPSTMLLPLGTGAPGFELPDTEGSLHRLADFETAPALLVAFICGHCPFVKHVRAGFAALAAEYQTRPAPTHQRPSLGCNIKWKPGNEPSYSSPGA